MGIKIITLGKINQTQKDKHDMFSLMLNLVLNV